MSNVNFYKSSSLNNIKSFFLVICMISLVIAFGFVMAQYFDNSSILYIAVVIALLINIFSYWYSDKIVLKMANAKEVKRSEHRDVWNSLENLIITNGMKMPKFYIIDDPSPNAFATGRNEDHAVIAATTGLVALLNKNELESVLAHELTHIKNKDILLQTIVAVFASFIAIIADIMMHAMAFGSDNKENKNPLFIAFVFIAIILMPIAATIVRLAISRKREFMADAGAVIMTRYPEAMANALQKISDFPAQMKNSHPSMSHMYIFDPVRSLNHNNSYNNVNRGDKKENVSFFVKMFMTHPPIEERISAIMGIKI